MGAERTFMSSWALTRASSLLTEFMTASFLEAMSAGRKGKVKRRTQESSMKRTRWRRGSAQRGTQEGHVEYSSQYFPER